MKFRYISLILVAASLAATLFTGCKTSEANYRSAYEKAIAAGDDDSEPLDSTIYGQVRRQYGTRTISTSEGEIQVQTQLVRITENGGGTRENLKQFNVVAGQFKQLFNASSFRDRLADAGYPGAFIVETAEPYYYIIAESFADPAKAASALKELKAKSPVPMKDPCPFLLDATARGRQTGKATKK